MNDNFKIICIIINIIKVNNIKTYTKNTHFITRKYGITRNFDKIEHIIICMYRSKEFFNHPIVTNELGTNFNAGRKS